jgi:hypothetical protein
MSDLAPFVAATIRDKVVVDLKEENDKLREQLRQRWTVQVLRNDEESRVVYATGQFDQGQADTPFWKVSLSPEAVSCPLSDLANVELHIGGIMKASFEHNSTFEGFFDADDDDSDTAKSVSFCFTGQLWFGLVVNGWPRRNWERVAADEDNDPDETLRILTEDVATEFPNATVTFKEVQFFLSSIGGAIQSLEAEEVIQQQAEESGEIREVYNEVVTRMREAGYEGNSFVFLPQAQEVMDALMELGMVQRQHLADGTIDGIIQLHRQTRDNAELGERTFQDWIHDLIRRAGQGEDDGMEEDE